MPRKARIDTPGDKKANHFQTVSRQNRGFIGCNFFNPVFIGCNNLLELIKIFEIKNALIVPVATVEGVTPSRYKGFGGKHRQQKRKQYFI